MRKNAFGVPASAQGFRITGKMPMLRGWGRLLYETNSERGYDEERNRKDLPQDRQEALFAVSKELARGPAAHHGAAGPGLVPHQGDPEAQPGDVPMPADGCTLGERLRGLGDWLVCLGDDLPQGEAPAAPIAIRAGHDLHRRCRRDPLGLDQRYRV